MALMRWQIQMLKLIKNSNVYLPGKSETRLHFNETGTVRPILSEQLSDSKNFIYLIQVLA